MRGARRRDPEARAPRRRLVTVEWSRLGHYTIRRPVARGRASRSDGPCRASRRSRGHARSFVIPNPPEADEESVPRSVTGYGFLAEPPTAFGQHSLADSAGACSHEGDSRDSRIVARGLVPREDTRRIPTCRGLMPPSLLPSTNAAFYEDDSRDSRIVARGLVPREDRRRIPTCRWGLSPAVLSAPRGTSPRATVDDALSSTKVGRRPISSSE